MLRHAQQALFVISCYVYVPSTQAYLHTFLNKSSNVAEGLATEYSVITLSCCHFNPRTPTSSATPDAFRSRLWVVIVRTFGARSDRAVGGSARIKNYYGLDQRYSQSIPSCSILQRGYRLVPGSVRDKQLKGFTCLRADVALRQFEKRFKVVNEKTKQAQV